MAHGVLLGEAAFDRLLFSDLEDIAPEIVSARCALCKASNCRRRKSRDCGD
jgi:hypothetical protein